jgi:hypothetical protein
MHQLSSDERINVKEAVSWMGGDEGNERALYSVALSPASPSHPSALSSSAKVLLICA